MANINLLPGELRAREEKIRRAVKKQRGSETKYYVPQKPQAVLRQPSISLWQKLFGVKKIQPTSQSLPFKKPPEVIKVGKLPRSATQTSIAYKLKKSSNHPAVLSVKTPAALMASKHSSIKQSGVLSQSSHLTRPFWSYFLSLRKEKLLPAPSSKINIAPPVKSKNVLTVDYLAFLQIFVYILIIIIILSFYFILRTNDNRLQIELSSLNKRVVNLQNQLAILDQTTKTQIEKTSAVNYINQARQWEVWQFIAINLPATVKVNNLEFLSVDQVRISGSGETKKAIDKMATDWSGSKKIQDLVLGEITETQTAFDFSLTFTWRSATILP